MKWDTIFALFASASAAVGPAVPQITRHVTEPYIGVPFNVVIACIFGAYASFSFGDKVEPRSKMFNLWLACVIMGCAFTGAANAVIGFVWEGFKLTDGVQASLGAIVSCLTRFWLPSFIEAVKAGEWRNWIPVFRKK